jgi:hypothetical protein
MASHGALAIATARLGYAFRRKCAGESWNDAFKSEDQIF